MTLHKGEWISNGNDVSHIPGADDMSGRYPNSGILSRNDRKEQPKHPDHKGTCEIDGREYWISAWIKEGQKGKFFSLSFQPKEAQPTASEFKASADKAFGGSADLGDDIPFSPEWR